MGKEIQEISSQNIEKKEILEEQKSNISFFSISLNEGEWKKENIGNSDILTKTNKIFGENGIITEIFEEKHDIEINENQIKIIGLDRIEFIFNKL